MRRTKNFLSVVELRKSSTLGLLLVLISVSSAVGQDSISSNPMRHKFIFPGSLSLQTDQDFLFMFPRSLNEDRNYTQGTSIMYSHERLMNFFLFFPQKLIQNNAHSDWDLYGASVAVGGTAFTPRIIDSVAPIVGDRPFAFLLYLHTSATFKRQKRLKNDKYRETYHTFNINYGVFGTNVGYEFQGWAHKNIVQGRPTDPKGWNTQISKGGKPTILLEYNRFQSFWVWPKPKGTLEDRSIVDLGWNVGGSIGYYDRAYTGLFTRIGHLRNKNQARWNGGFSSLTGASYEIEKNSRKKVGDILEAFVYGRANGTFMLRNSMLVGQQFVDDDIYTLKPGWVNHWLCEFEWGVVLAFEYTKTHKKSNQSKTGPQFWAIHFRSVYRSPEFDSGIFPVRWHYFGSLGLTFPFFN